MTEDDFDGCLNSQGRIMEEALGILQWAGPFLPPAQADELNLRLAMLLEHQQAVGERVRELREA